MAPLSAQAFRAELMALVPALRGFARFCAREPAMADDLVQETILRALSNMHSFQQGTDGHMRGWCFTILRNLFLQQVRKGKRETALLEYYAHNNDTIHHEDDRQVDSVNELERHLWRLSPLLREALVLIGAQEMTYAEAAMVCGVGIGTMKARVSRARATLRALLEETGKRQDKTFTE
ncbi:sigma-70 family RNA polymerase sigma factor [Acetobacter peroxydans]|uniref:sigma-70 family RNA polymerase sigma factor n=1 Tax=Acetobacter peroxydans TaxID=104098 RepID=UPI0023551A36|nr:sigma-70 family RNA polymerase sigma factor [Acetobacter peroxydans]MCH4144347.1 sigma-70 family RNA polymerase sigma factor [Acetobacter peroxydans]MCI1395227.1 sigma-70 family RNA polymerase sigma factor [Acetobacter peroxydans]MCI1411001.1 sigma-70 family RNA polymerase sigma factor [Acetobacter peroxydans]MCI1439413.1 sigma-70 family RNA polymerase sigma factor [Acetobacter peroxydans]MCI1566836.1 sigma-70 family RNA polymerase sigma factor [Acetobacter peroxydans]